MAPQCTRGQVSATCITSVHHPKHPCHHCYLSQVNRDSFMFSNFTAVSLHSRHGEWVNFDNEYENIFIATLLYCLLLYLSSYNLTGKMIAMYFPWWVIYGEVLFLLVSYFCSSVLNKIVLSFLTWYSLLLWIIDLPRFTDTPSHRSPGHPPGLPE